MNVCGKALPPKAATLLFTNTLLLVVGVPAALAAHSFSVGSHEGALGEAASTGVRLGAIGLFCQIVFYYSELYNLQIARDLREQAWRIFAAIGVVMLALAGLFSLAPHFSPGRDALLGLPIASIAVLLVTRQLAMSTQKTKAILVGSDASCRVLAESLSEYPEWNLSAENAQDCEALKARCPLGRHSRIIVCADANLDARMLETLMELKLRGVRVESAAQFTEQATGRVQLDQINPEWFVFSSGFENGRRRLLFKRCFDWMVAGPLALLTAPVMLLAAAAIAIEGKGPLFYRQERVGLYGRTFQILKFRTMIPTPAGATPQWTQDQDKRITPLGRLMRRFRIDELPQLLNVLRGDMSLIGPRPEQRHYCELLAKEIPFYDQRHTVLPGLTGWAQVRFMYGASVEESRRKLEYDLFYLKNLSLWLDLAIAFETLKVVLSGRGAK